ncbi:MAG TPA: insulinase family protein [Candidatus Kapabacteria bacterium]|nr:insulinase family protein [Candidatus Kapabacteria bacterium]
MKKTLLFSFAAGFFAALTNVALAQVPSDIQDFTSHGIHVILRTTNANQVVSAVLGFEGGLAYGETDNVSVAGATAALITRSGSERYPKSAYRDSLARLSTTIAGSGNLYHMTFTLKTIRPNFNSAWNIFSDVLLHPLYDTLEEAKWRAQSIQAIMGRSSDPEGYSAFLADSIWRGASPLNRVATIDEVKGMSVADMMQYRDAQFQRSRTVLALVGNVTRAELEAKLASLESLPMGSFSWPKIPHIVPVTDQYQFIPKPPEFPTTYVNMRAASADMADNDWWAERVMIEIMDRQLFNEVRTKRNLSYSPQAYPNGSYSNFYTAISLQSVLPDSAAHVVFDVVRNLQNSTVSPVDLHHAEQGRITTYYYIAQENLRQAQFLYSDQVEAGDWRLFFEIVPKTEAVTADQVREVANKYLHHFTFVLLGAEGKATQDVYHFE